MEVLNIDLTYILDGNGWSSCHIFFGNSNCSYEPTHVFNNPLEEITNAGTMLMSQSSDVSFDWFDEPGLYRWNIVRDPKQKHLIDITISTYPNNDSSSELLERIRFRCKVKELLVCLYYQLEKLDRFLGDKAYSKSRNSDFPWKAYKDFKSCFEKLYS